MDDERSHAKPQQPEDKPESFWRLAAQATTLGWNLVVPIVGGVLLGRYLDDMFHKEFTWTLSLLLMGVAVAFNNLYAMYSEQRNVEPLQKRRQKNIEESENHAEKNT
jgi:predicted F0F1-ATPase subunit